MTDDMQQVASPQRRRDLLRAIYPALGPDELDTVAGRIERCLAATVAPRRVVPTDQREVWVIAYPDQLRLGDDAPLAALQRFVATTLRPSITGVHVLPLHPSTSDGGFSVVDPLAVDHRWGSWDDVERLAATCSVMGDAVVNHLSASSTWFAGFLAGDPNVERFFVELDPSTDTSAVIRPRTSPLAHPFRRADGTTVSIWTTFSADQVDLDYTNPNVTVAMIEVLCNFVVHGVTAIRLDAIAFAWKDPASPSMSLAPTHLLVQLFRSCLDTVAPGMTVLTETNVAHAENVSYFGDGTLPEATAVYQFALPPLVLDAFVTGDASRLALWAAQLVAPPAGCRFANMLATHDGIGLRGSEGLLSDTDRHRLAVAVERAGGVVNWRSTPAGDVPYELAVAWFAVMAEGHSPDDAVARHLAAHAVLLAMPGVPMLAFNSLFGIGNDTETFRRTGHGRDLNRGRSDDRLLAGLADPASIASRCWAGIRQMLDRRARSAAFDPGSSWLVHPVDAVGREVFAVERHAPSGERALVAVNVGPVPQRVHLDGWPSFELEPWGHCWLVD